MIPWEENFPKGFGHTNIAYLKRCTGYEDAKNGDMCSARFVVSQCVKRSRIMALRERYPDAILLPVVGRNKLPMALAEEIGLPVWDSVTLLQKLTRKHLCAIERFMHKPLFTGYIRRDAKYILVDDVITQGGTISALRELVLIQGGKVVAVVALAFAIGSHAVAPLGKHKIGLFLKFGFKLPCILRNYEIAEDVEELTNSQMKYLLRFSSAGNIERKMEGIFR